MRCCRAASLRREAAGFDPTIHSGIACIGDGAGVFENSYANGTGSGYVCQKSPGSDVVICALCVVTSGIRSPSAQCIFFACETGNIIPSAGPDRGVASAMAFSDGRLVVSHVSFDRLERRRHNAQRTHAKIPIIEHCDDVKSDSEFPGESGIFVTTLLRAPGLFVIWLHDCLTIRALLNNGPYQYRAMGE